MTEVLKGAAMAVEENDIGILLSHIEELKKLAGKLKDDRSGDTEKRFVDELILTRSWIDRILPHPFKSADRETG